MRGERRGPTLRSRGPVNPEGEEPVPEARPFRLEGKSRMRRESHVRFCEGGGVKSPSATRLGVRRTLRGEIIGVRGRSELNCTLKP